MSGEKKAIAIFYTRQRPIKFINIRDIKKVANKTDLFSSYIPPQTSFSAFETLSSSSLSLETNVLLFVIWGGWRIFIVITVYKLANSLIGRVAILSI